MSGRIWLIQFQSEQRWIATGHPCYSLADAVKKLRRYRSQSPATKYRVAEYTETAESRAESEL
jgi:hypothetical protein